MERHGERFERKRQTEVRDPEAKPTVKQVYAVARALCERCGEEFPETRGGASRLIDRLRAEGPGEREAA